MEERKPGKIVPGCSFDSWGECLNQSEPRPSLCIVVNTYSPHALEGPPVMIDQRRCTASSRPGIQETCSHFKTRTSDDNERDSNI